tara:strand:+ start:3113 stop:3751 length:639 start_codon:yes stop_codon:yes gene_type:complete
MATENRLDLIKPFGPWIAKINIPEDILLKLNNYVDQIIIDEEKSTKQDLGKKLAGNVKQEFELDENFRKESGWENLLKKASSKWIEVALKKKISEFNILDTWVVRQFANEYNPIHFHSGHLSGAGFLKLPNNFGKTTQDGKINQNGSLTLVHGSKQFLSSSMYAITPKVGDFYLFPHYLMHMVYPFYGTNEERRSISFNAKIDENIFDVYKQ